MRDTEIVKLSTSRSQCPRWGVPWYVYLRSLKVAERPGALSSSFHAGNVVLVCFPHCGCITRCYSAPDGGFSIGQSNHLLRVVVRKGRAGGLSGVIQSRRRHCPTRKCSPKRPNLGAPPHHYLHQSSRGATTGRRASHPGNYCCAGCDGAVSASALGVHGGRPRRGSLSLLNCEERK